MSRTTADPQGAGPDHEGVPVTGDLLAEQFDRAASRYDLLVGLNPGYHRHLRSAASALRQALPSSPGRGEPGPRIADLGCGSGASSRALVDVFGPGLRLTGLDASDGMLARARRKRWPAGVAFHQAMAEDLAARRDDLGLTEAQDGVLGCYLFRNVPERDKVLSAVADLLRPGGVLVVQDYSVGDSARSRLLWSLVCWLVVIPLSILTGGHWRIYRYLWRSVLDFDSVPQFAERLQRAGFTDVEFRTVAGWQRGILHTFRARKPE
jgi:ubiquinone/menaquinone biosynthesis C-methylase UbiE